LRNIYAALFMRLLILYAKLHKMSTFFAGHILFEFSLFGYRFFNSLSESEKLFIAAA